MSQMGWIKLHRQILDSQFGGNLEMIGLFSSLLLMANHKDGFAADGTKIKKGSFMTSQLKLSTHFKMNRLAMRRKLKKLENAHQIEQRTNRQHTIITVLNWDKYQGDEHQSEQRVNNERTTNEQRVNTNKNANNDNNEKNDKNIYSDPDTFGFLDQVTQVWNETIGNISPFKPTITFREVTIKKFYSSLNQNKEMLDLDFWRSYFKSLENDTRFNGKGNLSNVATLDSIIRNQNYVDALNGQLSGNKDVSHLFALIPKDDEQKQVGAL